MYKGDLSNSAPKRVLVNVDILFVKTEATYRKFFFLKRTTQNLSFDKLILNRFYLYGMRSGLTLELVSFTYNDEKLELIVNEIERAGVNPFRYYKHYPSPRKLAADLAYRPEVLGVIDPMNKLVYGSRSIDL